MNVYEVIVRMQKSASLRLRIEADSLEEAEEIAKQDERVIEGMFIGFRTVRFVKRTSE